MTTTTIRICDFCLKPSPIDDRWKEVGGTTTAGERLVEDECPTCYARSHGWNDIAEADRELSPWSNHARSLRGVE